MTRKNRIPPCDAPGLYKWGHPMEDASDDEVADWCRDMRDPARCIGFARDQAQRVIDAHQGDQWPADWPDDPKRSEIASIAESVVWWASDALETDNMASAFWVGHYGHMLQVMFLDGLAAYGRKKLIGLAKAREMAIRSHQKVDSDVLVNFVRRLLAKNSKETLTNARRIAAEHFELGLTTVREHTPKELF